MVMQLPEQRGSSGCCCAQCTAGRRDPMGRLLQVGRGLRRLGGAYRAYSKVLVAEFFFCRQTQSLLGVHFPLDFGATA